MNATRVAIGLLPYALVSRTRRHRADQELLATLAAATTDARKGTIARQWHLDLLPPGSLRELETVIDIGANVGDWNLAVLDLARPRRLIAVEPQPDIAPLLRDALGAHAEAEVVEAAVGATTGEVELHIAGHSHNASLLRPRSEMDELYGSGWDLVGKIRVPMVTLDDLAADIEHVSLLKLDVQGAESEAMRGGQEALRRTNWILIEVCFRSHYEGDALFPDLHAQLTESGFRLIGLSEPRESADGRPLWADALYERAART